MQMYDFFLSLGNFWGIIFPDAPQAHCTHIIISWGRISIFREKEIFIQPKTYIFCNFWLN
jgi:hypothetical protein